MAPICPFALCKRVAETFGSYGSTQLLSVCKFNFDQGHDRRRRRRRRSYVSFKVHSSHSATIVSAYKIIYGTSYFPFPSLSLSLSLSV